MGFPVGYSELLLPKLLLHLILFLGLLRRFLSWAFATAGLGDLLDPDAPWTPDPPAHARARAVAVAVDDVLPVVRYDELRISPDGRGDSCAVCLHDLDGAAEVRRLANCRHVFHRACLDRWMAHEQRTCPLCRAPLFPGGGGGGDAAAPAPDSAAEYDYAFSLPSQALLLPHQLLSSGYQL